jgi:hypothetical protein
MSSPISSRTSRLALSQVPIRYGNTPTTAPGEEVSGNFFTGLGVPMAAGVGLTPADEQQHTSKVVLSYGFWTTAFSLGTFYE